MSQAAWAAAAAFVAGERGAGITTLLRDTLRFLSLPASVPTA